MSALAADKTTKLLLRAILSTNETETLAAIQAVRNGMERTGFDPHNLVIFDGKNAAGPNDYAMQYAEAVEAKLSAANERVRALERQVEDLSRPKRARYQFLADDRLLEWRHACYLALTTNAQAMDGATLVVRSQALARFSALVWRWQNVDVATIVEITRRLIADEDDDDLLDPMRADDKRSTPPPRDWASLRLKLQDEARG